VVDGGDAVRRHGALALERRGDPAVDGEVEVDGLDQGRRGAVDPRAAVVVELADDPQPGNSALSAAAWSKKATVPFQLTSVSTRQRG